MTSLESAAHLVRNVSAGAGLVLLGYAAYHAWRGGPYPARRHPRRLAAMGAASLVVAIGTHLLIALTEGPSTASNEAFPRASSSHRADPDDVFSITAPEGWTLALDAENHAAKLTRTEPSDAGALVTFGVDTSRLINPVDTEKLATGAQALFVKQGLASPAPPFADSIAGKPAHGFTVRPPNGELCSWTVALSEHRAANVQCFDPLGDCRQACLAPLAELRWHLLE